MLELKELEQFTHSTKTVQCKGCTNRCKLTVNTFPGNRKMISGNKCERFTNPKAFVKDPSSLSLMAWKAEYMASLTPQKGKRGKLGIPMALNMWELLPFWYTLFTALGYEVHVSGQSTRDTYLRGQATIPSDTICYPAKLVHGHILSLVDQGITTLFYPCSSYNIDEEKGDAHWNCPVVAYYPEVIRQNIEEIRTGQIRFIDSFVSISDRKFFPRRMRDILSPYGKFSTRQIKSAAKKAYRAYDRYMKEVQIQGRRIVARAREQKRPILVIAGRPYHNDPEISHGIDSLILTLGCAVVTADAIAPLVNKENRKVLNQWTYHSRMYDAARYTLTQPDMHLVQLTSFGCGLDAVTCDEIRDILRRNNRIYTLIKIDEITNLGAVKIRLRSLLTALEDETR